MNTFLLHPSHNISCILLGGETIPYLSYPALVHKVTDNPGRWQLHLLAVRTHIAKLRACIHEAQAPAAGHPSMMASGTEDQCIVPCHTHYLQAYTFLPCDLSFAWAETVWSGRLSLCAKNTALCVDMHNVAKMFGFLTFAVQQILAHRFDEVILLEWMSIAQGSSACSSLLLAPPPLGSFAGTRESSTALHHPIHHRAHMMPAC